MKNRCLDTPPPPERRDKLGSELCNGDAVVIPGIGTVPVRAVVPFAQAPRRITPVQTLIVLAWGDLALLSRPGQTWNALTPTDPARRTADDVVTPESLLVLQGGAR